ncbi:alpha/beta hydrolase [Haladaptatus pallidirubidus]|uniref:Alpha/beta hydrolase fold-3 domain-containing protein n=1 Tax=Haladaptatus pallidirubidus TaxID=1008152 RepID=A0AAV3UL12_9EURY|nr:alpha/beta hydrolase [Haladaptatus pallidirubidus]
MTTSEPHPDVQRILRGRENRGIPPLSSLSVDGARKLLEELWVPPDEPEPVAMVRDVTIDGPDGGVPIRIYTPDGSAPFPIFAYFHGGGWSLGSVDVDDSICRAFANEGECVVVSVGYRLAPEHPFPAALEDCYAATNWVATNFEAIHGDPDRLAVGGESAGGNLAAAVAQVARDRDGPSIAHQILVTPATDYSLDTESYDLNPDFVVVDKTDMEWAWETYLESHLDGQNPYASPLQARTVADLPPATVLTCEFDVLREDGIAYAERLSAADVLVTHRHYDDMIHGFIGYLDDPKLARAREAIADIGRDLQTSFAR